MNNLQEIREQVRDDRTWAAHDIKYLLTLLDDETTENTRLKAQLEEAQGSLKKVINNAELMNEDNKRIAFKIKAHNKKLNAELKEAQDRIVELEKRIVKI